MGIPSRISWSYFIASRNQIFLLKTVSFENFSSTRFIPWYERPKILNEIAHKYLNNHKFHGMSERITSILIWWIVGLQMFHIFFLSFDETFNLSLIILPKVQRMWFCLKCKECGSENCLAHHSDFGIDFSCEVLIICSAHEQKCPEVILKRPMRITFLMPNAHCGITFMYIIFSLSKHTNKINISRRLLWFIQSNAIQIWMNFLVIFSLTSSHCVQNCFFFDGKMLNRNIKINQGHSIML